MSKVGIAPPAWLGVVGGGQLGQMFAEAAQAAGYRVAVYTTEDNSPAAQIADDVSIGPFCMIGPEVQIGSGTRVMSNVVIDGPTVIGKNNVIHPFASIGAVPQDKKFHDADRSRGIPSTQQNPDLGPETIRCPRTNLVPNQKDR